MKKFTNIGIGIFIAIYFICPFTSGLYTSTNFTIIWMAGFVIFVELLIKLHTEIKVNEIKENRIQSFRGLEKTTKEVAKWLTKSLDSQIQSFYSDKIPEVSSRIIKAFPLEIKIGNDETLVDVNYEKYYKNPIETLEEAYKEFLESDPHLEKEIE